MGTNAGLGKRITTLAQFVLTPLCCFLSVASVCGQIEHDLVAQDDTVHVPAIEPISVNVLKNDYDTSDHELTVTQVSQGNYGTVLIDSGAKTVTYTPGEGYVNEDTFTYAVSDGELTAFASVTVKLFNSLPLRDTKGGYDGIIQSPGGPIGSIKVTFSTTSITSSFTGSARLGGKTYRFQDALINRGASVALPKGGRLNFTLTSEPGYNIVTGHITAGGLTGQFTASQLTYGVETPTLKEGEYTLVADNNPAAYPSPGYPQGAAWAKATISKTGLMRIRGKLGDGKVLSASAVMRDTADNPSGEAPLYVPLYAPGYRGYGSYSGVLTFADQEDSQTPDFEGTIRWRRPDSRNAGGTYAAGFVLDVYLIGGRFSAPSPGTSILEWSASNYAGQLYTDDGNQPNDVLKKLVTLLPGHKVKIDDPGTDKLKINIASNGLVTGSFLIDRQRSPTRITGVVFQKLGGFIEGQFLGRGEKREPDQVGWFGMFAGRNTDPGTPPRGTR